MKLRRLHSTDTLCKGLNQTPLVDNGQINHYNNSVQSTFEFSKKKYNSIKTYGNLSGFKSFRDTNSTETSKRTLAGSEIVSPLPGESVLSKLRQENRVKDRHSIVPVEDSRQQNNHQITVGLTASHAGMKCTYASMELPEQLRVNTNSNFPTAFGAKLYPLPEPKMSTRAIVHHSSTVVTTDNDTGIYKGGTLNIRHTSGKKKLNKETDTSPLNESDDKFDRISRLTATEKNDVLAKQNMTDKYNIKQKEKAKTVNSGNILIRDDDSHKAKKNIEEQNEVMIERVMAVTDNGKNSNVITKINSNKDNSESETAKIGEAKQKNQKELEVKHTDQNIRKKDEKVKRKETNQKRKEDDKQIEEKTKESKRHVKNEMRQIVKSTKEIDLRDNHMHTAEMYEKIKANAKKSGIPLPSQAPLTGMARYFRQRLTLLNREGRYHGVYSHVTA